VTGTAAALLLLAACGNDGGGSAVSFCDAAASFEQANTGVPNPATSSPEELEAKYREMEDALDDLRASAPASIEAEVTTMTTTFRAFFDAFAAAGYDYEQLVSEPAGLAAANGLSSDAMAQATGALEQHIAEECGS
jgi:hypothetical protein